MLNQDEYYPASSETCFRRLRDDVLPAVSVPARNVFHGLTVARWTVGVQIVEEDFDARLLRCRLHRAAGAPVLVRSPEFRVHAKPIVEDENACHVLVRPTSLEQLGGRTGAGLGRAAEALGAALVGSGLGWTISTIHVDGAPTITPSDWVEREYATRKLGQALLTAMARQVHVHLKRLIAA